MPNKGLLVKDGEIQGIDIQSSDHIHELIGNWFTSCFTIDSPDRRHVWLTGYCDDEFLLRPELKYNVVLEGGALYTMPYPIGGPIVITATFQNNGETTSMTSREMERFFIDYRMGAITSSGVIPTLRFNRGERWTVSTKKL